MKRAKFCEVLPGTRFRFEGRDYQKQGMNLAERHDQALIVFPSDAEVELLSDHGELSTGLEARSANSEGEG